MLIGDFDDLLSESLDGSNMKEERGQAVSGVDGRGRGRLRWPTVTHVKMSLMTHFSHFSASRWFL